jgi:hypothetical protein
MDPGGPKTCESGGSGTLFKTKQKEINLINSLTKTSVADPCSLNPDPNIDPGFLADPDPDPDPGFYLSHGHP